MSTRCLIAIEDVDGSCRSIYCHHDGYTEGVGAVLKDCYKTLKDVENLFALGDLSSLGETLEDCYAYCRDGGEELRKPRIWENRRELAEKASKYADAEYVYLFILGEWLVSRWKTPHNWERF